MKNNLIDIRDIYRPKQKQIVIPKLSKDKILNFQKRILREDSEMRSPNMRSVLREFNEVSLIEDESKIKQSKDFEIVSNQSKEMMQNIRTKQRALD
ncbi:UNKNOWN [Stylonychia lemnae]|uniref:Uncharacterized protein n=1 Tax=Stylonychia lemnae TaxID=5949 RepID=A0A078A6V6_STYLE|nr:UNKNOWN [Stylonychia lemnae]|eukprot:CDW77985.1 UNKNOWN [Stylonychia lemnae]